MLRRLTALAFVLAPMLLPSVASAHLVRLFRVDAPRERVHTIAWKDYAHAKYVCVRGTGRVKKKHCRAIPWLLREWQDSAPLPVVSLTPWLSTYYCERGSAGWSTNTGNGYYGGLQFDHETWTAFGGQQFAYNAHLATPEQQVIVAWRVNYDAWPHCPNP